LRLVGKAVLIAMPVLTVACDPGVSIRQVKLQGQSTIGSATPETQLVLEVKTTRQLIGETWYDPEVKVTNSGGLPITITNIELAAKRKTYANTPPQPEIYPLTIQPGNTKTIDVMFRLDDAVYKTFEQAAELSVHYRSGEKQETVRVSVIGGRR
jgi:hypothetical protein